MNFHLWGSLLSTSNQLKQIFGFSGMSVSELLEALSVSTKPRGNSTSLEVSLIQHTDAPVLLKSLKCILNAYGLCHYVSLMSNLAIKQPMKVAVYVLNVQSATARWEQMSRWGRKLTLVTLWWLKCLPWLRFPHVICWNSSAFDQIWLHLPVCSSHVITVICRRLQDSEHGNHGTGMDFVESCRCVWPGVLRSGHAFHGDSDEFGWFHRVA